MNIFVADSQLPKLYLTDTSELEVEGVKLFVCQRKMHIRQGTLDTIYDESKWWVA